VLCVHVVGLNAICQILNLKFLEERIKEVMKRHPGGRDLSMVSSGGTMENTRLMMRWW
jgi:hypothetical protein